MKPHLPVSLFKAVALSAIALATISTTEAETFVVDGINKNSATASTRFYDSGKGYYWTWNKLRNAAQSLYYQNGNSFAFLGDLASRVKNPNSGVTDHTFDNLTGDSDTCWLQTANNVIEYWLDSYCVFYTGSAKLPYGYTYDKKYLSDLGGTQSLAVGMYLEDSFINDGGTLDIATEWFLRGKKTSDMMRKNLTTQGGFFKSYFPDESYHECTYGSTWLGNHAVKTSTLAKDIRRGLGFSVSTTELERPGQIVYLGLTGTEDEDMGHAITCYGMETDSDGNAYCLYVCNSDDCEYKIFPLYVKKSKDQLRLFSDPERTTLWKYASTAWYIDDIMYIDTPSKLLNMAKQYADKSNPMIWTGKQSTWSATMGASQFTLRQPAVSDGWVVAVDGTNYPIFYEKNRAVEFSNYAIPKSGDFARKVTVSGSVNVKQMRLTVDSRDADGNYTAQTYRYIFNGTKNANIVTTDLYFSNYGFYYFNDVNLTTNTLSGSSLNNPWLVFGPGTTFTVKKSYEIPSTGFYLDNSTMSMPQLTLSSNANLRTYGNSKFVGDIVLNEGGILSFEYPTAAGNPKPFLTITGDLGIQGSSSIQFVGLNEEGIYQIATFKTISGDINKLGASCPDLGGSKQFVWVIPNKTLTFVLADSVYRFAGSGKVWQDGSNGFKNSGKTVVVLGFNAATTVEVKGKVTPRSIFAAQDKGIVLKDGGSGNISGTAKLNKTGTGTLNIDLANTYTGGTYIYSGTILTSNASALGKGKVTLYGGTLNMGGKTITNTISVEGNGYVRQSGAFGGALILTNGNLMGDDLNIASGKTATLRYGSVKNKLVGLGKVTKDTTSTVNLYGSNGYRGGTIVKEGLLIARNANALGAGKVTMTGGTLSLLGNPIINTIDINTTASTILRGTTALQGNFVLTKGTVMGDDINISAKKTATLKSGTIKNKLTGAGKIVKNTTGLANLANSSTHTGGTTINDGTLVTKNPTALGTGKVTITGGTLDMSCKQLANSVNISATKAALLRSNKFAGSLTLTSGAVSGDAIHLGSGKNAVLNKGSISNDICGAGNVYKKTTGTVTLTGASTWTGNTYVQAGTLALAGNATLFGTVRTYSGATLSVKDTAYFMNLYLGGGTLTSTATAKIVVPGTVTLGSATRLNVTGMGDDAVNFLSYGNLNNPGNWDLTAFFKLTGSGYAVLASNGNLVLVKQADYLRLSRAKTLAAPDLTMPDVAQQEDDTVEIAETPVESEEENEPAIVARDITADELSKLLGASGPVYAAEHGSLAQSAWGTARAARLFDHTVRDHGGSAANLSLDEHGTRSAWFATMSGFSRVRAEGAAMGADNNTYGGVVGMQFNGALGGNAGLAIGQSYGKVSPMGAARVDQQTQHAAIYGTKTLYAGPTDSVQLTGTVSYGTTDSDCNSNGHGFEWTQHSVVVGARGTWAHAIGHDTHLYTFAGLEYLSTDSGDTENGKSGSVQDFQGAIGAGVSHTMGKLTLRVDAAFEYDFVRHNPVAESAGRRGTVSNPGRIGVEVRAGANYRINDRWNAEAGYSCHAAQHNTSHEAHVGASYSF